MLGSPIIWDRPLAGKYENYVPNLSKMSISQAIKTSESETIELTKEEQRIAHNKMWILIIKEATMGKDKFEYIFNKGFSFRPCRIVKIDHFNEKIYKENGNEIKNVQELIDYVDSWF